MFEIYRSIKGRKTFLVVDEYSKYREVEKEATKFFRVSKRHLQWQKCWILNDELYFEDPCNKKAKKMVAISWRK